MGDLFYRTEDIRSEEVMDFFVETKQDRSVISSLKSTTPIVLVGSRGVGKSFLLRVAESELTSSFAAERIMPVYVTFSKSSLIHTVDPDQFQHWMIARLCSRMIRSLARCGLLATAPAIASILAGGNVSIEQPENTQIQRIADSFEESWKNPGTAVDTEGIPDVEEFKDAVEDLCQRLGIRRFALLIDEAAHIFLPEQQRQFFTLFRDLRSPYITCNATVYPGVTSFGDTFQPAHDAAFINVDRNILSADYVRNMREIVHKQADSTLVSNIAKNGENFALLAYAASGNPRTLLKTVDRAPKINSLQVNEVIREYYRSDIWSEHSALCEKYGGHRSLIDWGRRFVESHVLPELQKKNAQYLETDRNSTCFFWIHRDAPEPVKEALRLLAYTGIVAEHSSGIKATRAEIGTRYAVNLGCLFSLEPTPAATAFPIAKNLTPKRMSEYGANHPAYSDLLTADSEFSETDMSGGLQRQLAKSIDVLDITDWQKGKLREMGLQTAADVLCATETKLQEARYVGEKRSRRMRNAAIASVYEYLSG